MKILLIDATASFLDFALRCEAEGHEVRVYISNQPDGSAHPVGDGVLHKVSDWRSHMTWADLILASDNCKYMRELEGFRRRGFPLYTSNVEVTEWELDRSVGQRILEDRGIECLPSIPFTKFTDAIDYQLAHKDKRFVCKPCADVDKSLSYVSKSFKDMVFMLEQWKKKFPKPPPFIFQEFCPGIEVAVGGWMGRDGFAAYFLENFEFKKLMPGEVGPNTGEMGTAMKYVLAEESKLARELLLPLEPLLIRSGFTGYIDVAVMMGTERARKGKLNPLEFTSRHGWPLFQIQQALHPEVVTWMKDALNGVDTFQPRPEVALGVLVAMPDFPYGRINRKELCGFPVWGVNAGNRYNFHPCEMKLGSALNDSGKVEPMLVSAGNYVFVVTGTGMTVCDAREAAYKQLKEFEVPNSPIYRNDLGCRLEEQLPLLQQYGYCESWEW